MWYNKYVGIPYKDNGRDLAGLDCWGLVRLVYSQEYGIELPSFSTDYTGAADLETTAELISINKENWQKSQNRIVGSVVLFKVFKTETHVGIYVGNNKFLHARQGHASVIESLDATTWKNRLVGYFEYSASAGTAVTAVPSPLKTQHYTEIVQEGLTLKSVIDLINQKYGVSDKLKSKVVVFLNGKIPSIDEFDRPLTKFDKVEYRLVPTGSNPLRSILMIAVVFAAMMAGQYYIAGQMSELAAASAAAGEIASTVVPFSVQVGAAAVTMGVNMVGMALVDAIAPIRLPKAEDRNPGSPGSLNLFNGGSNRLSPYAPIPVVLGKMRFTPPLASASLLEPKQYTSYMSMNLCWGIGDIYLDESTLMVGSVGLNEYIADGRRPQVITLNNGGVVDTPEQKAQKIAEFNKLFSTDIKQVYPNADLVANAELGIPGPWTEVVLENPPLEQEDPVLAEQQKINKFNVTFSFPEGLRKVWTGGGDAGKSLPAEASFEIQYARKNPVTDLYEPYIDSGTNTAVNELKQPVNVTVNYPDYIRYNGQVINLGRWTRLGLRNNSLVILHGQPADIYSTTGNITASQSNLLKEAIASGQYNAIASSAAGFSNTVFPEFDSDVIPLHSFWCTKLYAGYEQIDHTQVGNISRQGLQITLTPAYTAWSEGLGEAATGGNAETGTTINIATGKLINSNVVRWITLNELRKDGFNYTTPDINVEPGDYKVRIRRLNDSTAEYAGDALPAPAISNPFVRIPSTGYLGETGGYIHVGIGRREYLQCTEDIILGKNTWRLISVEAPTGITMGTVQRNPDDTRGTIISDIVSVSPSFTSGTITYVIEVMTDSGTRYEYELFQYIEKSSNPNAYYIIPENSVYLDYYSSQTRVRFYKAEPSDQLANSKRPIYANVENYYYTSFLEDDIEPATATRLDNWDPYWDFSQLLGTVENKLYTLIIRLYNNENKTELLDEVRIVRRNNQNGGDPFRMFHTSRLYTITGYSNQENFIPPKYKQNNQLLDCNIVRTAIRLQSTSKVNGQVDGINGIVQSMGFNWYPTSPSNILEGEWRYEPINNPASLFLYVLMHQANTYRVNGFTQAEISSQVDIDAIKQWHYYCAQQNFTFNTVLDSVSSIMDVLRDICAAGRASPLLKDGKWSVVVDQPKTEIVQHFTPHNSWGFESIRTIPRIPDAFRCVIRDEENSYQDREIVVYNLNKTQNTSHVYEQISLPGITNQQTAKKHIRWNLAQLRLRPERYTINTDLEYLVCNRGDRVKIAHDVPLWGTASGRIGSITITGDQRQCNLDDVVLLEANTNYVIRVRLSNGKYELGQVSVTETKYYESITYTKTSSTGTLNPAAGDLFLIGETDTAINDLVVLSIEPLDNKSARLVLVDYSAGIYTENHEQMYSNITDAIIVSPPSDLQNSIVVAPVSAEFMSGEYTATTVSDTLLSYNIRVILRHAEVLPSTVTSVEIQYIPSESNFDTSLNITRRIFDLGESIILPDVEIDKEYKIRIRYVGTDGRAGPWMLNNTLNYFTYTVQRAPLYDDRPQVLNIDLDRSTLLVTISRDVEPPANFSHYEFRVLKDPDSVVYGDFWSIGDNPEDPRYVDLVKATTINNEISINLLNFSRPRIDPDGIMYRIACRSVDTNNNISSMSLIGSYLVTPLT